MGQCEPFLQWSPFGGAERSWVEWTGGYRIGIVLTLHQDGSLAGLQLPALHCLPSDSQHVSFVRVLSYEV